MKFNNPQVLHTYSEIIMAKNAVVILIYIRVTFHKVQSCFYSSIWHVKNKSKSCVLAGVSTVFLKKSSQGHIHVHVRA